MKKNKLMAGVLASIMLLSTACGSAQTTVDSSAAEKSAAEEYPGLMGRKPFSFVQKKNKTT